MCCRQLGRYCVLQTARVVQCAADSSGGTVCCRQLGWYMSLPRPALPCLAPAPALPCLAPTFPPPCPTSCSASLCPAPPSSSYTLPCPVLPCSTLLPLQTLPEYHAALVEAVNAVEAETGAPVSVDGASPGYKKFADKVRALAQVRVECHGQRAHGQGVFRARGARGAGRVLRACLGCLWVFGGGGGAEEVCATGCQQGQEAGTGAWSVVERARG